ncbi:hypothetical protein FE391_36885 [Nonomuraea sp. KC401]|uniref:hypothetical protein n=1 Tax=unclassified Nonomuraea TaxID=2593643 RepID=UPI0010FDFB49|nr:MULTISPECIES: hypothetical protein [unclassified Nonomuraea]NBE99128.1 hypothetical protein [Nonomuraea sp. K271]TLF58183.1 hypothetical protein FE391_36885 [Nonomuraea sp. KC401]
MGHGDTVYRWNVLPWWPLALCWAALAALAVVMPIVKPARGDVPFVVDALGYALVWGIPAWVALLTMWSVRHFGRIVVTRTELRVGRHRLPVGRLSRDHLYLLARDLPGLRARLEPLPDLPWPRLRLLARQARWSGKPLGGAFAAPFGVSTHPLLLAGGSAVEVATRDLAGLVGALLDVVPETPVTGPSQPRRLGVLLPVVLVVVLPGLIVGGLVWYVGAAGGRTAFALPDRAGDLVRRDDAGLIGGMASAFTEAARRHLDTHAAATYARDGETRPAYFVLGGEGTVQSPPRLLRQALGTDVQRLDPGGREGALWCATRKLAGTWRRVCGWADAGTAGFVVGLDAPAEGYAALAARARAVRAAGTRTEG